MDHERLAELVIGEYVGLPLKFRLKPTEWTVLAAIVAYDSSLDEYRLISMSTGTKCNGFSSSPVDPYSVRDCHAEAICRRGLLVVLWKDVLNLSDDDDDSTGVLLVATTEKESNKESTKKRSKRLSFSLKPTLTLHLFISDLPCGSASEFGRVSGESTRVTGAKLIASSLLSLRTKPGRSDLPPDKQTRCMSCSDKVVKWTSQCGIQGALLHQAGLSVSIASVVLSRDAMLSALESPQRATQPELDEEQSAREVVSESMRLCLLRLPENLTQVYVSKLHSFPQSRQRICPPQRLNSSKGSPSGACLSWICVPNGRRVKANAGYVEMLVGMRGVREGAMKTASSAAVASDLCKASLFQFYRQFDDGGREISYLAAKQAAREYAAIRSSFLERFPEWNVNQVWDDFVL
ncbi:hypothetical protein BASA81_006481 [Batrachochytrium salamandrivorans]|nr:hypothetical protein BASA81_006481 [Batrachochytrium salamandrivorans]